MESIKKGDYLKTIYHLQKNKNRAIKSVELAKDLGVSKASVNEMIKKLANSGLVEYKRYTSINLTKRGIREAERIVYKHKILEGFLLNILGIKKSKIHSEAHKLEHDFSDDSIKKLEKILKKPETCPHGDRIPDKDKEACLLDSVGIGEKAEILFTKIKNKKILEKVNSLGFVPNTKIKVLNKIRNGPIELSLKNCKIALGKSICRQIYVKKI